MWRCKNIIFKYAKLQENSIYIPFLDKEEETFLRRLPKHWKMSQTKKKKIVRVNSAYYMLGTLLGAYSSSFKSFCENQWSYYYYYSPFPVRKMRHREVHFPAQNCTANKRWHQNFEPRHSGSRFHTLSLYTILLLINL